MTPDLITSDLVEKAKAAPIVDLVRRRLSDYFLPEDASSEDRHRADQMADEEITQVIQAAVTEYMKEVKWWEGVYEGKPLTKEQIFNELHDYRFLMKQASIVYCEVTGNKMSKTSYYAEDVISEYQDYVTQQIDEALEEERKFRESDRAPIVVDIGAAQAALEASPELGAIIMSAATQSIPTEELLAEIDRRSLSPPTTKDDQ